MPAEGHSMCRASMGETDRGAFEELEQWCGWVTETEGDEAGELLSVFSFGLGGTRRHRMCVMWQSRE